MGANLTIYCLEKTTDYFAFERLCHDLMSKIGYKLIEPLGKFKDKGRDAIHISTTGETTIFAYSVREDWRAKLSEDANKVRQHGHSCDKFIFVTTASVSAGEHDEAISSISGEFGWAVEIFSIERLRILLDVEFPEIKELHPAIFPPEFLAVQRQSIDNGKQEPILLIYGIEDFALARWLVQRLTIEGYRVWAENFSVDESNTMPGDIDAIHDLVYCVISIYSQESRADPEIVRRQSNALLLGRNKDYGFVIPLNNGASLSQLDHISQMQRFVDISNNWAQGLTDLLRRLEQINCPRPNLHGSIIPVTAFYEKTTTKSSPEDLISNCLEIIEYPKFVYLFKSATNISGDDLQLLRDDWPLRRVSPNRFLSFFHPPQDWQRLYNIELVDSFIWQDETTIAQIDASNLVSELIRKSIESKCREKGLVFCPITNLFYFPKDLVSGNHLLYALPDGKKSYVLSVGERTYWRPLQSEKYQYSLAPVFSVKQDFISRFDVLLTIRIRFSSLEDHPLTKRTAQSRRKHLCGDWWNHEWLARTLAICQFLADDTQIGIGRESDQILVLSATPRMLKASSSIDEENLDQQAKDRTAFFFANSDIDDTDIEPPAELDED